MPPQPHFWRLLWLLPVAFAVQTTWLAPLKLGGVSLDLAFGVALCAAMLGGARVGFWAGAGAGYLAGLAAMWHPGSFLLARLVPCVLAGLLAPRFRATHPLAPPLVAVLGAVLGDAIFLVLSPNDFPLAFLKSHLLGAATGQMLLSWPLFALTRRVLATAKKLVWG